MTEMAPVLYQVVYSEVVQADLRELVARATEAGCRASFLAAVKELDRLLHLYPQFGEPLLDLRQEDGRLYTGTMPPLVARYAIFENRRLVFVGSPIQLLPSSGF